MEPEKIDESCIICKVRKGYTIKELGDDDESRWENKEIFEGMKGKRFCCPECYCKGVEEVKKNG